MEKKVRIGIIGCGGIANGKHMPSYRGNPDCEMVAFCDIIEEKAIKANKTFGNENTQYYTDYRELLKREDIDAVSVCTPNFNHCEISCAALLAGKHVLCEKPMAMNYAEALKMIEARDKSGKILTIGYQNRYNGKNALLKKFVDQDYFGEVYYAEAIALRRRAVPTWGVFLDVEKQGGGPLIDIGTHALDLTLNMMQNYEPKYCVGKAFHKLNDQTPGSGNNWGDWKKEGFTAEDSAFGFIMMKNGAVISLKSSWALNIADPMEARTLICGTKAGADTTKGLRINKVINGNQMILEPSKPGGVDYFPGDSETDGEKENKVFINAILGKGDIVVKPEEAAVVTRILETIYKSSETGEPVYFD